MSSVATADTHADIIQEMEEFTTSLNARKRIAGEESLGVETLLEEYVARQAPIPVKQ